MQSCTLATKMLLLTTATAKALDQRNVVVYDALSNDQQSSSLPILLSSLISIVMAKARRKRCTICAVFVRRLNDFVVTSMMRE